MTFIETIIDINTQIWFKETNVRGKFEIETLRKSLNQIFNLFMPKPRHNNSVKNIVTKKNVTFIMYKICCSV